MKIFIPSIGTNIKLLQDWMFTLFCERRNYSLWSIYGDKQVNSFYSSECFLDNDFSQSRISVDITIPQDTILQVDRIYIRKGDDIMQSFDSVSFIIKSHPADIKGRFWSKLADVNAIECEVITQDNNVTSYVYISKNSSPSKIIKMLHSKRITVIKSNKQFITISCPIKRLTSVFGCKIKSTKKKGIELTVPPLYYCDYVDKLCFTHPNGGEQ